MQDTVNLLSISVPGQNTERNGSLVRVVLKQPITFNLEKYNVYCRLLEASIWWTIPNIDSTNNVLHIVSGVTDYILTFDKGLYDISSLNSRISNFMRANSLPSNGIIIIPDTVTQKISLQLNSSSLSINMAQSTIKGVLGFDNILTVGPGISGTYYEGSFQAKLNTISNILIHSDFTRGTYFNSDQSSGLLAIVTPDVRPGSQIVYRPFHPIICEVSRDRIDRISFTLTDQNGHAIDTNNESFSILCEFIIKKK